MPNTDLSELKKSIEKNKKILLDHNKKEQKIEKQTSSSFDFSNFFCSILVVILPAAMILSLLFVIQGEIENKYIKLESNVKEMITQDKNTIIRTKDALFTKSKINDNEVYILEKSKSFNSNYNSLCHHIQSKTNPEYFKEEHKKLKNIPFNKIKGNIGCYFEDEKEPIIFYKE